MKRIWGLNKVLASFENFDLDFSRKTPEDNLEKKLQNKNIIFQRFGFQVDFPWNLGSGVGGCINRRKGTTSRCEITAKFS